MPARSGGGFAGQKRIKTTPPPSLSAAGNISNNSFFERFLFQYYVRGVFAPSIMFHDQPTGHAVVLVGHYTRPPTGIFFLILVNKRMDKVTYKPSI